MTKKWGIIIFVFSIIVLALTTTTIFLIEGEDSEAAQNLAETEAVNKADAKLKQLNIVPIDAFPEGTLTVEDIENLEPAGGISKEDLEESFRRADEVFSSVDEELRHLKLANIAYNAPRVLNIEDENTQIELVMSFKQTIEELKKIVNKTGEKFGARVKFSNRMEARLSGHNFKITAITSEVQAVSMEKPTSWKWEVSPIKEGIFYLHLTLTAFIEVDGISTRSEIRTFDKQIYVEVRVAQKIKEFVSSNLQWLWATFLVPLVGFYWKRRKTSSSKQIDNK